MELIKFLLLFSIIFFKFITINYCWNLNNYNISENYYVSSIGIYYNRIFLALPRIFNSNNYNNLTIIEVNENDENENPGKISNYNRRKLPIEFPQIWNNCKHIQNAVSIKIEMNKARLWILDQGNDNCPSKIIIYNLLQNIITHISELIAISNNKPNFLLIDTSVGDFSLLNKAYVGYQKSNLLSMFNLNKMTWNYLLLENDKDFVSTEFLALSKRRNLIFMTGSKEIGIYGLKLDTIEENFKSSKIQEINATYLGDKLGPSSGLVLDYKEGLIYYLIRDYAIVRWNTRKPSQAENYQILLQSYQNLPHVTELVVDSFNNIWALINYCNPNNNCDDGNSIMPKNTTIKHLLKL